jgi:DNA processing protein
MQRDLEEYFYWLALKSVPGVGNQTFRRLLTRFGTPENVFKAPPEELFAVEGISPRVVSGIRNFKGGDWIRKELAEVKRRGFHLISFADDEYPGYLRQIHDPPPILYINGEHMPEIGPAIGIVGSRHATQYGIAMTRELSSGLVESGLTVVSGMARGIDTAAHEGALTAHGKTVAVLGCGLGTIYPPENEKLYHKIAEQGAVISEFPIHAMPEAHHFPIRNRIISGMSLGTLIVEATTRSGSLITAQCAMEQGREVFAVPGSVRSFKSTGTHQLIKQGAKLVENVTDIIEELDPILHPQNICAKKEANNAGVLAALSGEERRVLEALTLYPIHIDTIIRQLSLNPGEASGILLQLEIKGVAEQMPGKLFVRKIGD